MATRTLTQITAELSALRATASRYDAGFASSGKDNPYTQAILRLTAEADAADLAARTIKIWTF